MARTKRMQHAIDVTIRMANPHWKYDRRGRPLLRLPMSRIAVAREVSERRRSAACRACAYDLLTPFRGRGLESASQCTAFEHGWTRSAPRCGAGTVSVVVLAPADDLLLNDVVTMPVLASVGNGHRSIATAVSLVVRAPIPLLIGIVVIRRALRITILCRCGTVVAAIVVRVARCGLIVAAVLARCPRHADSRNDHQSRNKPQHL